MYKYKMRARPFDIGCQPRGHVNYEPAMRRKEGHYGILTYTEPLSAEDVRRYELIDMQALYPATAFVERADDGNYDVNIVMSAPVCQAFFVGMYTDKDDAVQQAREYAGKNMPLHNVEVKFI